MAIKEIAVRISLYDGESAPGNFDDNDNYLTLNGFQIGNFTSIATQQTQPDGTPIGNSATGFGNNILSTGFFYSTDSSVLASIYATMTTTESIVLGVFDDDFESQYYNFKQGIDSSLIDVGTGPVVTPPNPSAVPLPAAAWLLVAGLGGLGIAARRKKTAA